MRPTISPRQRRSFTTGAGTPFSSSRVAPRVVCNVPVYVGNRRGYSIAAVEERGIGYAIASDLSDRESAELVASIH